MKTIFCLLMTIVMGLVFSCAYQFPEVEQGTSMVNRKIGEAEALVFKKKYLKAEKQFSMLLREFLPGSQEHEIVLYNLVLLNLDCNNPYADSTKAKKYLEEFVKVYPQSHYRTAIYVVERMRKDNHDLKSCKMELDRLRRALKVRDKSIKKLQSEIEAYKKIDWEREEKKRQIQR